MNNSELYSNEFVVRWDGALNSLLISHPDTKCFPQPHVQIRAETIDEMDFETASQFIGSRLALLIPALRERYVDPATGLLLGRGES